MTPDPLDPAYLASVAPPLAPLAMPTQVLERPGLWTLVLTWLPGLTARPQG